MAGLTSQAVNKLDSKYGYQGDFSEEEDETGYDEFNLRDYDPQIGRWNNVDPYVEFASGYVGMGGDPISNVDPNGGFTGIGATIAGAIVGAYLTNVAINGYNRRLSKDGNSDNKIGFWGRAAIDLFSAWLGSGVGYSINASLLSGQHVTDGSTNFWQNLKAYYVGWLDPKRANGILFRDNFTKMVFLDHTNATIPHIWNGIPKIEFKQVLPKWKNPFFAVLQNQSQSPVKIIVSFILSFTPLPIPLANGTFTSTPLPPIWLSYQILRKVLWVPYFK